MAVTPKHLFGWQKEEELLKDLEDCVKGSLVKTQNRYDTIDFVGESCVVELKSRLARDKNGRPQNRERFSTWLVPVCKADWKEKPLVVFYYWAWDQTLWRLDYSEELWSTFERSVPYWKESQEHFYVPSEHWTLVKRY